MTTWLRVLLVLIATVCLLGGFSLWILTRSWFIIGRVTPELERRLGGEVTIDQATYEGHGRFLFRGVTLRVAGQDGPGGEVLSIQRATVVADMAALFSGVVRFEDVELGDLVVRLSEDAHDAGVFSFMALDPDWTSEKTGQVLHAPRVKIDRAIVEVGVHDGDDYRLHGRRALSGSMLPIRDGDGWYSVALVEVNRRGEVIEESDGGILVKGRWNADTNAHAFHINGLALDERAYGMGPQIARLWWERMQLTGRVSKVDVRWSAEEDFKVEFTVQDVGLTLPIETTELWARYRDGRIEPSQNRPRMHVQGGRILLARDAITLDDLQGELLSARPPAGADGGEPAAGSEEDLVGVPYRVSLTIEDLPELDWAEKQQWMDKALATAPFRMHFRTDDFRVHPKGEGQTQAVELPLVVARVLERFRLTDWVLSTGIEVTREAPQPDEDGNLIARPIRSTGQAFITDASGTYQKFPYPLSNVEAHLEFDNEKVTVHYLTGTGAQGSAVRLSGTIAPPTNDAAVSLQLVAHDVPVDEQLRGALSEGQQKVFDALMHRPSFQALAGAGLLLDQDAIEAAKEERRAAAAERTPLAGLGESATSQQRQRLAQLEAIIRRRQHLVDAGPFQLGGTVDLDLTIERPEGPHQPTITSGLVTIQSLGLLYERFPYPLQVPGGTLHWQRDEVTAWEDEATEGLSIIAPGGGSGRLSGRIDLPRVDGKTRIRPDLTVTIHGDEINDLLYAAIPPVKSQGDDPAVNAGWPGATLSRSARWLKDLAIQGVLDYTTRITADTEHQPDYHIDVQLLEGSAQPARAIREALGGAGLIETDVWQLEDCRGRLAVNRDTIELEQFTARHLNGLVSVDGRIDLQREPADLALNVRLDHTSLGEYLINLLPSPQADGARALWDRYRPQGTFDADLQYRRRGDAIEPVVLRVRPDDVLLHMDGQPVTLASTGGQMRVDARQVHFDDLTMRVSTERGDDGRLALAGAYGLPAGDDEEELRVSGTWHGGHLQSPLIGEALRCFGADDLADRFAELEPGGEFDASFSYASARAGRPGSYELTANPSTLTFKLDQTPMFFELEDGSEIVFTPGLIELRGVRGRNVAGTFNLAGEIRLDPLLEAALRFNFDGQLMSSQIAAFLPAAVRDVSEAIEFREGQPSSLRDGVLRLTRQQGPDDGAQWAVDFTGRLNVEDASFTAGLDFSEVSGPLELKAGHRPPQPPYLQIQTDLRRARTLGQHLTEAEATISLNSDGTAAVLHNARADAQGGVATARATVGIGDRKDYAVSAQLVGVPLGDFVLWPPSTDPADGDNQKTAERPSGLIYAGIDLSGQRDDVQTRVGRGVVRVLGGKLASVPLTLQLLNLFQFTSPSGGPDFANAEFYVTGDRVTFERILFESTRGKAAWLQLFGVGQLDLNTFEIDARFHSRSAVLLLRDVVGEIGDQLVAIEVTGPLWDPEADIVTLPNISKPRDSIIVAAPLVREGGE